MELKINDCPIEAGTIENCNQCAKSNNARCTLPRFQEHLEKQDNFNIAYESGFQAGMKKGEEFAINDFVIDLDNMRDAIKLVLNAMESGDNKRYMTGKLSAVDELLIKYNPEFDGDYEPDKYHQNQDDKLTGDK